MNSHPLITLLVPTVVAIASWFAGSWLSARRDQANKRRDLRIQYLIEAYRRIAVAVYHLETHEALNKDLNDIFAGLNDTGYDLQLFGSADQIKTVHVLADQMLKDKTGRIDGLLSDLRNDLRKELKLEPVEGLIRSIAPFSAKKKSNY